MRKLVVALALLAAGWAVSQNVPPHRASPTDAVTLLMSFGLGATSVERWDGSLRATGGRVLALEGRHFSAGDRVVGADRWVCTTREDRIAPYADIHYTEMRPGAVPQPQFQTVGLWVTVEASTTALEVETAQGKFRLRLAEIGAVPLSFLKDRAQVRPAPTVEKLTTNTYEDDEPSLTARKDGSLSVAWVAYRDRADRVLARTRRNGAWSEPEEVTLEPADIFRTAAAEDSSGGLWIFAGVRDGGRWHIWGRRQLAGRWQAPLRLTEAGSNIFHRAAAANGRIALVWQSFREGQSDVYLRVFDGANWSPEQRVSESPANDWEPAVAVAPDGTIHIAWDGYDKGNYDIYFRSWRDGQLSPVQAITSSPRFEAHANVAVDPQGRPWVAWDYSGVNWAKDQGFLIPTPLATPIHQQRNIGIAVLNGSEWLEPRVPFAWDTGNSEHPQVAFDGRGVPHMVYRRWTRRNALTIGSPMSWENFATRWDATAWSRPLPLNHSQGSIEKHAAMARDASGDLWAAWMTDERPFATGVPANAEVYAAKLTPEAAPANQLPLVARREAPVEEIPTHLSETADIRAIRDYRVDAAGKQYRIYRGDMHRHTDISQDFKYDGSLIEVYRYALDAAGLDYIAATDHQSGYDQEFTWWQNQKLADLFYLAGRFTPLFAYERSVLYPNGHRNVIFAHRGVRTLPIPPEEASGNVGAARLYDYLRKNNGISMPHSSATNQGTDWRDNDPEVEPLVEIYQGYRTSYEYEGAPRAATSLNLHAQKSGWQPSGFLWNAWAKGYRLGVQSSSDHWSTHISYACLIAENFTREGLLDAIRQRHTYAATDNIVLDVRSGGHLMGDTFTSETAPRISVHVIGTSAIQQIDLIKDRQFAYTTRPASKETSFEFTDKDFTPGLHYYYVRVLQQDGQLAWSSPIWVKK